MNWVEREGLKFSRTVDRAREFSWQIMTSDEREILLEMAALDIDCEELERPLDLDYLDYSKSRKAIL
jgi:hypothetical protein